MTANTLTASELAAIKARVESLTSQMPYATGEFFRSPKLDKLLKEDEEFINHAREDVPRLLATIAERDERIFQVAEAYLRVISEVNDLRDRIAVLAGRKTDD